MRDELDRLRGLNASAADIYHRILMETRPGEVARRYLERRGVTAETMDTFNLGYAPDDWHIIEPRLRQLGYGEAEILEAGLTNKNDAGNVYDRFRGRVMFPIRDAQGRVIGFGGRLLQDAEGQPKYLNTPQTPLFDKGSVLYGIDLARHAIRESGTAVIVEGYMDVVVPYQCGVRNLVACMGTALTEQHLDQLKRITKRLILALDPDAAGVRATERGIETARQSLTTRVVPVPTATGLIRYEEQLQAEIRILALPDGLDPDELVLSDRARWDTLVEGALPVAEYSFQQVTAGVDLSQAKGKREAVDRLLPVIAAMDSPVERPRLFAAPGAARAHRRAHPLGRAERPYAADAGGDARVSAAAQSAVGRRPSRGLVGSAPAPWCRAANTAEVSRERCPGVVAERAGAPARDERSRPTLGRRVSGRAQPPGVRGDGAADRRARRRAAACGAGGPRPGRWAT